MVPATTRTNQVCGYTQPPDTIREWSQCQAQSYLSGRPNQESHFNSSFNSASNNSFDDPLMSAAPNVIPTPSSCKYCFPFATSRNRILTNHE